MADRATLLEEANARLWSHTGYKIGKPLDPKVPADNAMAKVWMAIFQDVQKQDKAGTLVMTHLQPEVVEALADAQVASDVAAKHLRAAAAASDPQTKQQHATVAAAAVQTATAKAREARAGQSLNVSPEILEAATREATVSAPPASAPAEDQIAHVQMQNKLTQNTQQNGQPPPGVPSREELVKTANERFWNRYEYKRGQKLDKNDYQDRLMIWTVIFHDVEREAREGRLALTPGVPQDPYADVPPQGQPPQDFSQPQYGGYGAPPGLTPPMQQPQYAPQQPQPQYAQDFSQPQYGGYGAPPGMTPPQYGAQQGFPQTPQYGGPQEMPIPQYGASQQVTPPQYSAQDLSQYGGPQQGFPPQQQPDFQMQQPSQAPQQPQAQPPQAPQPQVPRGMEGLPPDLAQYMQQEAAQQAAQQAPQQAPPQQQQPPQREPSRGIREAAQRGTQGASQAASRAADRASTALTTPPAASSDKLGTGAKIGVAVAAFGGLLALAYAASRGSRHARIRESYTRGGSFPALSPSRSGRY